MANQFEELKTSSFWKAILAEIVGTFILVVCGCGACLGSDWDKVDSPRLVEISLAFGLGVATAVWCIGHVSGGHINPAVSCGMMVARRISIVRCFLYILAQMVGAMFGAGVLFGFTPANSTGTLGMTELGNEVTDIQAFGVELIITFVLVLTVFASCDGKRRDLKGSVPLTIGLSVTLCHFFAVKFTGASMNPARTFGVAVVMNLWSHHWVYWVGPILGGVIAATMYEIFFAKDGSLKNFCCCTIERQPPQNKEVALQEKNELAAAV